MPRTETTELRDIDLEAGERLNSEDQNTEVTKSRSTEREKYGHVVQDGEVTVGGHAGYVFRRVYHVAWFFAFPIIYFVLVPELLSFMTNDVDTLSRRVVAFAFLLHFAIEPVRIWRGALSFGMREWEARKPSTQITSLIAGFLHLQYYGH